MRPDYYSILEISRHATTEEIKSAFRRMAMLHHPDKNQDDPEADEKFRKILEAYDVLSDEITRKKYDSGRNYYSSYSRNAQNLRTTKQNRKDYSFTEEELQKRKEFKERYDKYRKEKEAEYKPENLPAYNDFKYIMIAIPLAIGILFFIINLVKSDEQAKHFREASDRTDFAENETVSGNKPFVAGKNQKDSKGNTNQNTSKEVQTELAEAFTISPWNKIFGNPVADTSSKKVFRIENRSGADVVVCLFDELKKKVIRNYFITQQNYLYFKNLPKGNYHLNIVYGKDWVANSNTTQFVYEGIFDSVYQYSRVKNYNSLLKISLKDREKTDTSLIVLKPLNSAQQGEKISNFEYFYRP